MNGFPPTLFFMALMIEIYRVGERTLIFPYLILHCPEIKNAKRLILHKIFLDNDNYYSRKTICGP